MFKRVVLKLSGEALGADGKGFDHDKFDAAARMLAGLSASGAELAVVIGAGNVWRGRRGPSERMGAVAADQMGMLGTLQNCLYMADALARAGQPARVLTALEMPRVAETYTASLALQCMAAGEIVLLACGTGNPFFSTDTAVALRALELNTDVLLMAKNIDGVYTADPHTDPSARLIPDLTYRQAAEQDLRVMDAAAFCLLRENRFPLVRLFGLDDPGNILKVLNGDTMGTFLHP